MVKLGTFHCLGLIPNVNTNSFLFVSGIFGADWGISVTAGSRAVDSSCGFKCLSTCSLSLVFKRLLLMLTCCPVV